MYRHGSSCCVIVRRRSVSFVIDVVCSGRVVGTVVASPLPVGGCRWSARSVPDSLYKGNGTGNGRTRLLTKCPMISNNTARMSSQRRREALGLPGSAAVPAMPGQTHRLRRRRPGRIPARLACRTPHRRPLSPADKVKQFPTTPGVYLMKDAQGRVIYVGKAKNLRSRAGSYFHKTAADDRRICDWIAEVADIDFLAADSEVDALLMEARLIKDIQPKYNQDLKDDKSVPLPPDHDRRGLSARQLHPRAARPRRQALRARSRGPRACAARSRSCSGSSSSGPARSTSRRTTRAGGGFARACSTRSTSAPPRATSGSTASPTAPTSAGSASSSTARKTSS